MGTDGHGRPDAASRPQGSPEIPQFHLPTSSSTGTYEPRLYGAARIRFGDRKRKVDEVSRRVAFLLPLPASARGVDWEAARPTPAMPEDLLPEPLVPAGYAPLPQAATELAVFTRWAKGFDRWLARTQRLELPGVPHEEPQAIGPKRGGVSVELVSIVWDLT